MSEVVFEIYFGVDIGIEIELCFWVSCLRLILLLLVLVAVFWLCGLRICEPNVAWSVLCFCFLFIVLGRYFVEAYRNGNGLQGWKCDSEPLFLLQCEMFIFVLFVVCRLDMCLIVVWLVSVIVVWFWYDLALCISCVSWVPSLSPKCPSSAGRLEFLVWVEGCGPVPPLLLRHCVFAPSLSLGVGFFLDLYCCLRCAALLVCRSDVLFIVAWLGPSYCLHCCI